MSRKTKLTPQIKQRLIAAIATGVPIKYACAYAPIGEATYYVWINKAERYDELNEKVDAIGNKRDKKNIELRKALIKERDSLKSYVEFREELKKVEATLISKLLLEIQKDQSWQSKAWILERRYHNHFGRQIIEHEVRERKIMSDDEFKKLTTEEQIQKINDELLQESE